MAKKVPVRMCVGCGQHKEKNQLIRVVRNKAGEISLDLVGKAPGRGAYLCNDPECLKKAIKARRLEREFSTKIEPEVLDSLLAKINEQSK